MVSRRSLKPCNLYLILNILAWVAIWVSLSGVYRKFHIFIFLLCILIKRLHAFHRNTFEYFSAYNSLWSIKLASITLCWLFYLHHKFGLKQQGLWQPKFQPPISVVFHMAIFIRINITIYSTYTFIVVLRLKALYWFKNKFFHFQMRAPLKITCTKADTEWECWTTDSLFLWVTYILHYVYSMQCACLMPKLPN